MLKNKSVLLLPLLFLCISAYSQSQYYVLTLAGDTANLYQGNGANAGFRDAVGTNALFNAPTGIAVDSVGKYVYVADTYNNVIRKIKVSSQVVTTLAGDTADIKKGLDSNSGYVNGPSYTAKFNNPYGICVDANGNVYIADTYNNVIRKISTSGMVTTYAGSGSEPTPGYVNGPDSVAEFFTPTSLAIDNSGNIYVADNGNNAIREIVASTHMVTTIAGTGPDTVGYMNGLVDTAEFYSLYGIAVAKGGAIFATQFANGYNAIRRIYQGMVTSYCSYDTFGIDTIQSGIPSGYMNGNDTDSRGDSLVVGVLYNSPTGIAFDTSGNLLVADEYNNVIRMINPNGSVASTFAGVHTEVDSFPSFANGTVSNAKFSDPVGIAADKKGNFYVTDLGNNLIRIISTSNVLGIPTVKQPVSTLNVYPNPCIDRLNIVSSFNGNAELMDVMGRVIWTDNDFKSPYTLSTSAISPGIYFLRVSSPSQVGIQKVEILK